MFFSRRFEKLPTFWVVFLSAAYGLSGYALRQYHNFMWFEPVILLPLLLFYAERALRGKRVLPYALILGLSLILNLYITAMVCLYVFFAAGMYILLILKKEERGRATLRFALATVAALLISAFMTVPMLLALQTSARHGIESEIALFEAFRGFDAESGLILYSLTFAVPILLPYLFKALRGKRWREGLYHAGMLFIILAPLFFRGLSEVWHFGRYICYPNRFGFLMVFTILLACACALEQNERDGAQKWASDGRRKSIIMSVGALLLVLLFVRLCILGGDEYDELFMAGRKGYVWMTVIGVLAYTAILAVPFRRLANAMLALVLCAQIGTYSLSAYRQGADSSELNALRVMTLSDRFADRAPTERVCRKRDGAVVGFGPYLGVAEVGAYNSMLSGTYMSAMKTLLYGTTIAGQHNEQGGTLFSDALLGVTAVIAPENAFDETDSAYTRVVARSGLGVFECRYTLPFGIMGDAGLLEPLNAEMPADKQNAVFSALGGAESLLQTLACTWTQAENGAWSCTARTNPGMRYYLVKDADRWAAQDLGEPNGAELQLHLTADEDPTQVHLLSMDIRALEALCAEVTRKQAVTLVSLNDTGLTLTASADASAPVLMLPIANTPGWRCTVDGEETAIQPAVGTLIGIPLSPGTHSVELVFRTKGLTAGLVLTGLGVLLAAVIAWAERRGRMLLADSPRLINGITLGLLIAAWGGAIAVLYVYLILHAFWLDILFQMPV